MKETKLKPQKAPCCGHLLDATAGLFHDERPKAGDVTVCINCGSWLIFERDLSVRLVRDSEVASIEPGNRHVLLESTKFILERGLIKK